MASIVDVAADGDDLLNQLEDIGLAVKRGEKKGEYVVCQGDFELGSLRRLSKVRKRYIHDMLDHVIDASKPILRPTAELTHASKAEFDTPPLPKHTP